MASREIVDLIGKTAADMAATMAAERLQEAFKDEGEWLRGVVAKDAKVRVLIRSAEDRPWAMRRLNEVGNEVDLMSVPVLIQIKPHTVEEAMSKWAETCPFGDNDLAKAGFRAGWAAVFEMMFPEVPK